MAGDGSLYRRTRTRPNGETYTRWVAQASFGGRDDRRIVRRVCRTRAEAKAALEEMLHPVPASRVALGAYLRSWVDERAPNLARNTTRGYRHVIPHWSPVAHVALSDLTPEDVATTLAGMTLGPKASRNALGMLRAALATAERRGHVARNVARLVDTPKVPRTERDAMTPERARAILAAVDGQRYAAAVALGLCGLRMGETLGLAWADLELEGPTPSATLHNQLVGSGRRGGLAPLKTAGSAATVQLPRFAVEALRTHRAAQREERIAAGIATSEGLVFVTRRGYGVHQEEVRRMLRDALAKAGLPAMRYHDLRHAAATLLVAGGAAPRVAQSLLRHATSRMTMETYTHVSRAQEREAADLLDRLVGDAG